VIGIIWFISLQRTKILVGQAISPVIAGSSRRLVQAKMQSRASASDFFGCGYAALNYKILISSGAATISWWDRRFACHRQL
jgi:hypothetical protein